MNLFKVLKDGEIKELFNECIKKSKLLIRPYMIKNTHEKLLTEELEFAELLFIEELKLRRKNDR